MTKKALLRSANSIRIGETQLGATKVKQSRFIKLMIELKKEKPAAFYQHCAACCLTMAEGIAEIHDYYHDRGDPRELSDMTVHQYHREDIDARYKDFMPGDWAATYNSTYYIIMVQEEHEIVVAVTELSLLTADGILYTTDAYSAAYPLHPTLKIRTGEIIETLTPEIMLYLMYRKKGVEAYKLLETLGMADLTEAKTWQLLDTAKEKARPSRELPMDLVD